MDKVSFELNLLTYWKMNGVEWLYKYKDRIKQYRDGENLVNHELFMDMTSDGLFQDIGDVARLMDVTGDDVKVSIDLLIANRIETSSNE